MLFLVGLKAGKEKHDRRVLQTEFHSCPTAIGANGSTVAVYRRGPPSRAVSTRDDQTIRARGRWARPLAERAWAESRRDRRDYPGSLPRRYRQETQESASRRWTRVGKAARVASRARCCRRAGPKYRQRRGQAGSSLRFPSSARCRTDAGYTFLVSALCNVVREGDGRRGIIRYREGYTTGNHRFRMRGGGKTQAIGVCRSGHWDEGFSTVSCNVQGASAWGDWRSPDHPAVEARVVAQAPNLRRAVAGRET